LSSGILRRVALLRTDFSEELSTSFIRVTRIGELEKTLALTSNRRVTSQKTPFFTVTAVKTSNLTTSKLSVNLEHDLHFLLKSLQIICVRVLILASSILCRLRCLLLAEEESWTQEYVDKIQRGNEKKLEEMKLKVEEMRNKREADRQKLVQEKRIQQYL
jgi:hypothetical protein